MRFSKYLSNNQLLRPTVQKLNSFSTQSQAATEGGSGRLREAVFEIQPEEFKQRRDKFVSKIVQASKGNVYKDVHKHYVIIPGAEKTYVYDCVPHEFRQNSDFLYLTGIHHEGGCALLFEIDPLVDGKSYHTTLFVKNNTLNQDVWDGPSSFQDQSNMSTSDSVCQLSGLDECKYTCELQYKLDEIYNKADNLKRNPCMVWYDYINGVDVNKVIHRCVVDHVASINKSSNINVRTSFTDNKMLSPRRLLHELRLIKSPSEMSIMREACIRTCQAFKRVMRDTASSKITSENQLFASMEYYCKMQDVAKMSYPSVAAYGQNATVIHHLKRNANFTSPNLVLLDAGCEMSGYCSDVTRVWPVLSNTFSSISDKQKIVYEIVLQVQDELIALLKSISYYDSRDSKRSTERSISLDDLHSEMQRIFVEKLISASILDSSDVYKTVHNSTHLDKQRAWSIMNTLCPHHVGHFLGLEIHDTSMISKANALLPNSVITLEPGLYFGTPGSCRLPSAASPCNLSAKTVSRLAEFGGIGVRIEDVIVLKNNFTSGQNIEILSENCPKSVSDIQNLLISK